MLKMINNARLILLSIVLILLHGCVAVQPFPTIARAGDTISLAVGSPDGMTKGNTSAQLISVLDPNNPVDLSIRSIIKIRPDSTSLVSAFDVGGASVISDKSSHGPWLSIMVIDLPQVLPLGQATINITTDGIYHVGTDANTTLAGIEILPGLGTANPFQYYHSVFGLTNGNLVLLEPLQQVVIRPPIEDFPWFNKPAFGAAEIKVNVPTRKISEGVSVPDSSIQVIVDEMPYYHHSAQVQMNWSRIGDEFTVNFISPTVAMQFQQTRFSVVMQPDADHVYAQLPLPNIVSVKYYDANGVLMPDMPTASDYSATLE